MMNWKKYIPTAIGVVAGAILGYSYWYFWGCTNGCAITGSPVKNTLYFAFMGGLVPGLFKTDKTGTK
jgi:hypothetical protein